MNPCMNSTTNRAASAEQAPTQNAAIQEAQFENSEWLDFFEQECRKESCSKGMGTHAPGVPEYVRPRLPTDWNRRPRLPEAPEMLSALKQSIRHPLQITQRRKEMQTRLDKLTDEHEAFAFPSGTKLFLDNVYYTTDAALNFVQNYNIVCEDINMRKFAECAIKPSLLAFNRDRYKFFRERLPMADKRIINIPGNRATHWHNWIIRALHVEYNESWRKDIIVPDNWFGPAPSHVC